MQKKIKTGTLTFHASHNYGSMLQAYALQQTLMSLGVENEIINLRTVRQKKYYSKPVWLDLSSPKRTIKSILSLPYTGKLKRKYELFEKFLEDDLILTKEFKSIDDIMASEEILQYDYLITGSDQIWNTNCLDFDWSYFLPFQNSTRLSYAPSMGPKGKEQVSQENYERIKECLNTFSAISVREQGTAEIVKDITGIAPEVLVDPVLLLSKDEWEQKVASYPLVQGKYIFVYTPFLTTDIVRVGKKISARLKLPLVISNLTISYVFECIGIKKILDCGPWEFLNLMKYASFVLSGSFHAVVFSIIMQRPFLALNGDTDNRINALLLKMGLERCVIHDNDVDEAIANAFNADFSQSVTLMEQEKHRSLNFLTKNLTLKES